MKLFLNALLILYCFMCTLVKTTNSECKTEDYVCVPIPTKGKAVTASTTRAPSNIKGTTKGVCRKEVHVCIPKPGQKTKTVTTPRASNSNKETTERAVTRWWENRWWESASWKNLFPDE